MSGMVRKQGFWGLSMLACFLAGVWGGCSLALAGTVTLTAPTVYPGYGPSLAPEFNYGDALQKAWYFYEAQRSGPLPQFDGDLPFYDPRTGVKLHNGFRANRIPWRGASDPADGADVGVDLTGGWHDAGDQVKFGLPMAFSAAFLAWGVVEFHDGLQATGQLEWAKENLRWVADYFIRAHVSANELYGQVGCGADDHSIWAPPEVLPHVRPAWKIDMNCQGADLAAQTSAAMTFISMVFRESEPAYADVLLQHGVELYDFARATRYSKYSDCITDAQSYYRSTAGDKDDFVFAGAALYIATKDPRFLHDAEADYLPISDREGHHGWTAVWDDVRYGVYVLLAKIYADPDYGADSLITGAERHDGYYDYNLHAQNFLNYWTHGIAHTPGGMAWLSQWGSARYPAATAFLALVYRKHLLAVNLGPQLRENYLKFATEQVNYVLGDNPLHMSYMVGFGAQASQVAHHRAAHGSSTNDIHNPELPRHVLYGGLAGGPASDDSYTDDRNAFTMTEVACDINAGITGALAGLVEAYGIAGNEPDPGFPPASPHDDELYVKARLKTKQNAGVGTGVEVSVVNESAYPPRQSDGLMFRYFMDLSEVLDQGLHTLDEVNVDVYRDEGSGVTLKRWHDSECICYLEWSFAGVNIAPIGTVEKQKFTEFLVRLSWTDADWDGANDPSYAGLVADTWVVTDKIALYDTNLPEGSQLIWGEEPVDPGCRLSPPPQPGGEPAGSFEVVPEVYSSWTSGYCAKFNITNTGDTPQQPTGFQFILPGTVQFTNIWNGTISRDGDLAEMTLSQYFPVLEPGQSSNNVGYCASGTVFPVMIENSPDEPDADTDRDDDVDGVDLRSWAKAYENGGNCTAPDTCACDLNRDGAVDGADLQLFSGHFGRRN
ncbi:MAG: glycoside hydrolase family 9 protein [Deltaproteobacteria bacterium]|nr:glycoside hydrolase family 9 protein [Deltaproteobacteria bacterium]